MSVKCPSCEKEMVGGKYCSECGAVLVAGQPETAIPHEAFTDELTEKVAGRTAEIVLKTLEKKENAKKQAIEPTSGGVEAGPGPSPEEPAAKPKRRLFRE